MLVEEFRVSWNISTIPLTRFCVMQFSCNAVFSRNQNAHKSGNRCIPFNTWLSSIWEENKCKCTEWHLLHPKWLKLSFWVKIVVILSVAQLVTTVTFFSAWDKLRVKWDSSRNSTQKMRTCIKFNSFNL